jgi:dTDP-4-amino-4,6-dideoxygalactose transaminase
MIEVDWKIPLSDLDFGEEEAQAVQEVLASRWLTMGARTTKFEKAFADYHESKFAIAVSSCTAALHLACLALGLGPGDEVILPALTFVATANAVRYVGATPVFADIKGESDLNISIEAIRNKITPKTKALIVMHYAGYPCDMPAIMDLAQEHNLYVIEDAAHALGGELKGRKLGTWGDIGCFSFFSNKNLVTGEGGMLLAQNEQIAKSMRQLRSHGMTSLTWDRHHGHASSYDVIDLGFNYRIDEIRSALGFEQLKKLDRNNKKRRELTAQYHQILSAVGLEITIPFTDHPGISAAHIMPILLPESNNRQTFIQSMKDSGIQTSVHYTPIHQFSAYKALGYQGDGLSVTEAVASREITLPLYPGLSQADIEVVAAKVQEGLTAKT